MLLSDGQDLVAEILETLASAQQRLVARAARLPVDVIVAPDNLEMRPFSH